MVDQPYLPFEAFDRTCSVSSEVEQNKNGIDFKIELSQDLLFFEPTAIAEISDVKKLRIYNRGRKPITFRSFTMVGDFRLFMPYEGPLFPEKYYEISVSFAPERAGLITGGIYIDSEELQGNQFIKLGGVGGDSSDPNIISIYEAGFATIGTFTWAEDMLDTLTNITLPNNVL